MESHRQGGWLWLLVDDRRAPNHPKSTSVHVGIQLGFLPFFGGQVLCRQLAWNLSGVKGASVESVGVFLDILSVTEGHAMDSRDLSFVTI